MALTLLQSIGAILLGESQLHQLLDGVAHICGRRVQQRVVVVVLTGEC